MANIHQNRQIRQADFALTNLTDILSNFQLRQADFAVTNLTKINKPMNIHSVWRNSF